MTTLAQAQMMAHKVDLYVAHGGKSDAEASNSGSSGRGGARRGASGRKGKLGVVNEGPLPKFVAVINEKKKLAELQKKNRVEAKKIK